MCGFVRSGFGGGQGEGERRPVSDAVAGGGEGSVHLAGGSFTAVKTEAVPIGLGGKSVSEELSMALLVDANAIVCN